jgi:pimeloyl-ACP methyl ester carboxylesterase
MIVRNAGLGLIVLQLLASAGCDDSSVPDAKPSPDAPASCADIAAAELGVDVVVTTARDVSAGSSDTTHYPAHCAVTGQIASRVGSDGKTYAIGFELRLPQQGYDDRLFFQGGGGTDGVITPAYGDLINTSGTNALTLGYAVVSTDGGHATGSNDVSFGLDPQARIDYGYNAVGQVTRVAKKIVETFYGNKPRRSYFVGCSNGGRQAMVAAARFADEFDGILAVDPGFNLPKAALAQAWDTRQFMAATSTGQLPRDAFPPAVMATVSTSILARCDALDGLADGMVQATESCQLSFDFERDVPTCSEANMTACLTGAQKTALQNVFGGVRDGSGASLYAAWPWDPGVVGSGWRFWKLDAGFAPLPFNTLIGAAALGYIFTTPPDQPDLSDSGLGYQLSFDFDAGAAKIFARDAKFTESAIDFMTPPNPTQLSALKARGGKLVVVHGTADPVFSSDDTVAWYRALLAADPDAASYAKLFLVPGMNHCSGGPATDRFDMLSELQAWVDGAAAPDAVVAAVNPDNPDVAAQGWPSTRERLLCAYPAHDAASPGANDTEIAASFECR